MFLVVHTFKLLDMLVVMSKSHAQRFPILANDRQYLSRTAFELMTVIIFELIFFLTPYNHQLIPVSFLESARL